MKIKTSKMLTSKKKTVKSKKKTVKSKKKPLKSKKKAKVKKKFREFENPFFNELIGEVFLFLEVKKLEFHSNNEYCLTLKDPWYKEIKELFFIFKKFKRFYDKRHSRHPVLDLVIMAIVITFFNHHFDKTIRKAARNIIIESRSKLGSCFKEDFRNFYSSVFDSIEDILKAKVKNPLVLRFKKVSINFKNFYSTNFTKTMKKEPKYLSFLSEEHKSTLVKVENSIKIEKTKKVERSSSPKTPPYSRDVKKYDHPKTPEFYQHDDRCKLFDPVVSYSTFLEECLSLKKEILNKTCTYDNSSELINVSSEDNLSLNYSCVSSVDSSNSLDKYIDEISSIDSFSLSNLSSISISPRLSSVSIEETVPEDESSKTTKCSDPEVILDADTVLVDMDISSESSMHEDRSEDVDFISISIQELFSTDDDSDSNKSCLVIDSSVEEEHEDTSFISDDSIDSNCLIVDESVFENNVELAHSAEYLEEAKNKLSDWLKKNGKQVSQEKIHEIAVLYLKLAEKCD
ncbi:hypothetical protein ACFFRR_008968 [Megaselia abdita]